jgi:hypothetical protein
MDRVAVVRALVSFGGTGLVTRIRLYADVAEALASLDLEV